ncbi:hypothetical protein WR25_00063 [Diploscapter pachys]|uniref:Saposin B-type domain-containing protein n=1 Tax=Diploscapter pachys TaxID=2018661 RepID=A0A2A2KDZ4_9BILA|nr:hypothetical protein WR25_00063 [Diploscapter pachys]
MKNLCIAIVVAFLAFYATAQRQPLDGCQTCEWLMAMARWHFNNNVTDENALKTQLIIECQHLHGGSAEVQQCIQIVNNNIDKIYSDLQAGDRDGQTCYDIGECTSPSGETFPHFTGTFPTREAQVPKRFKRHVRQH